MKKRTRPRARRAAAPAAAAILGALLVSAAQCSRPADDDYRRVFGDRYVAAEEFLAANPWIGPALRLPPEETRLALAVVFPEIMRYSRLQDRIQARALKVLYVQYGRKYANFSIGHFQMKPSFVELLEADWNRLASADEKAAAAVPAFDRSDSSRARKDRVLRLDDLGWQVDYLRLFMAVMEKRYGHLVFPSAEDRLRFYATAFNAGYAAGEERIRRGLGEKHFHLELFAPKTRHNYADVAVYFFRRSASP